jgi:hypothetical protein
MSSNVCAVAPRLARFASRHDSPDCASSLKNISNRHRLDIFAAPKKYRSTISLSSRSLGIDIAE